MTDTFEARYDAVRSRDPRFDGQFFTAVTTTGIYCRPSCPARLPFAANVTFYRTAAQAQAAGFRACRRCRPEASPGSPDWNVRATVVDRALRLISDGVADESGVAGVAGRLGVGERQLHRLMKAELGVGPAAYARARRAQSARLLIDSSTLNLTDIAFAAGFSSIRQFNETMSTVFGCPPRELRRRSAGRMTTGAGEVVVRLDYRPPLAAPELLAFLGARAIAGIELCDGDGYRRTLQLPHGPAVVHLSLPAEGRAAVARLQLADLRDLTAAVQRVRRLLDLDADPAAIAEVLGRDRLLAPLVRRTPGVRVPGTVDGFELAVRAVLGQQVTVQGARTLAGRLSARLGTPLPAASAGGLTTVFPAATVIAADDLDGVGLTGARRRALRALAESVASGALDLEPGADREEARRILLSLPGIGSWTAEYVAMRALADPDAFPAGDLVLRNTWLGLGGTELDSQAERWRPWRAYAAMHVWTAAATTPVARPKRRAAAIA